MTGDDLKNARREMRWSQRELAQRAGVDRTTVHYWEAKAEIDNRSWAIGRIADALGWRDFQTLIARTLIARTRHGVLDRDKETANLNRLYSGSKGNILHGACNQRVACGAKTRKGTPCKAQSEPGKKRCRFHGGMSTGPKTEEGRLRIAEAQRKRWRRSDTAQPN
ncbi:HGGxSTG domain-containing protein [Tropicimonas aquimaris]|uniref:HGGxSTG domain-containing protein n=1 Tax=Tropicimonas aquimaris TaxID=914152 RepID=A0ABW3IXZ0_9RHOB